MKRSPLDYVEDDDGEMLEGFLWVNGTDRRLLAQDPTGGYVEIDLVDYDEAPLLVHLLAVIASGISENGVYVATAERSSDGLGHRVRIDPIEYRDAIGSINETLDMCRKTIESHELMRSRLQTLLSREQN